MGLPSGSFGDSNNNKVEPFRIEKIMQNTLKVLQCIRLQAKQKEVSCYVRYHVFAICKTQHECLIDV